MNDKARASMAVLVGVTVAGLIIMLAEYITHSLFPPPEGLDFTNKEQLDAFMRAQPAGMFLSVLAGYLVGALAGGWVTNLVAKGTRYQPAVVTGVGIAVFALLNMMSFYHPKWFWAASLIAVPLAAWFGGKFVRNQLADRP